MGTRRLPAADAAIIGLIEAPLAPLWVWLALDETPSGQTMIGGALVLAAAAGHIVAGRARHADGSSSCGRQAISS
jgi:drug/metabolite transporter (DMT)-like permease